MNVPFSLSALNNMQLETCIDLFSLHINFDDSILSQHVLEGLQLESIKRERDSDDEVFIEFPLMRTEQLTVCIETACAWRIRSLP